MLRASSILLVAALALGASACPPPPSPPPNGTGAPDASAPAAAWKPKAFSRATDGCTQAWSCDCSGFIAKAGCHIESTGDTTTTGVCAADSGPPTGCTRCMALPPPAACVCAEACP